nr:glycosyltransferase [uncultured Deefgea sp.]
MKILLVITGLGMGGAERQVCDLADQFSALNHDVLLVSLNSDLINKPRNKGVKLVSLDMKKTIFGFFISFLKMRKIILEFKPDVIHSHMVHANIFTRLLRVFTPINKLICTAHSTNEGGWLRMKAYCYTDFLADISTNVSEEAVEAFILQGAVTREKMIAVHNGINIDLFDFNDQSRKNVRSLLSINDQTPLILAVGRLVTAKDYPNLLNAFSKIDTTVELPHLAIIGVGQLHAELKLLAENLEIIDRVHFLGIQRDIPSFLSAADLFVLSSAWEGFGLVVAEAMACRRVVVATDCGGVSEVISNFGFLVKPKDSQALRYAMESALRLNDKERSSIGESARNFIVSNYSLKSVANKWISLYSVNDNEC